jgi:hypothetical protein
MALLKFVESEGWEIGKSTFNFLNRKFGEVGEPDYELQFTKLHYARPFDGQTRLDESALCVETFPLSNELKLKLKKENF